MFDLKVAGIESRHQPLQKYLYLAHKPSIEQTLSEGRSLFLLSMSGSETCPQLSKWPNGQVKTQSQAARRGVRLLLMTGLLDW